MSDHNYDPLLNPGESVNRMPDPEHGSQEWAYGYGFGEIEHSTHEAGNSVLLSVEIGGAVEPVLIENDISLDVRAVQGKGYAVVYSLAKEGNVRVVALGPSTEPLHLEQDDAYYYLNVGNDELILRDDSTPDFQNGDEVQLTSYRSGEIDGRKIQLPVRFWKGFEWLKRNEQGKDFHIEPIGLEDLDGVRPILERWIFDRDTGDPLSDEVEESLQAMRESIEGKLDRQYVVAKNSEGKVLGVMGLVDCTEKTGEYATGSRVGELINADVQDDMRGNGIGRALVEHLEAIAKIKGYDEIVLNSGPRYKDTGWGFWTKMYGESVGVIEDCYGDGADAKVWRRDLTSQS